MVSLVVCDKQITSASSKFLDGCRDFNAKQINQDALIDCNYSVPLFEKEGLGEILLDKSPSAPSLCSPPFSKGEVNIYD